MKQTPTWKPPAPLQAANLFPFLLLSLQTYPSMCDEPQQPAPELPVPTLRSSVHHEKSSSDARRAQQGGAGTKLEACEGMQGRMQF